MENKGKNSDQYEQAIGNASGVVSEALPNTQFKVKMADSDKEVLCYLAGKMRLHRIRVLVGDKVEVVLDPYGGKGRIVRRL